jgi:hypothetical protein
MSTWLTIGLKAGMDQLTISYTQSQVRAVHGSGPHPPWPMPPYALPASLESHSRGLHGIGHDLPSLIRNAPQTGLLRPSTCMSVMMPNPSGQDMEQARLAYQIDGSGIRGRPDHITDQNPPYCIELDDTLLIQFRGLDVVGRMHEEHNPFVSATILDLKII